METIIRELLEQGLTNADISRRLDIASSSVSYWRKKLGLPLTCKRVNWTELQKEYDNGKTLRQLGVSLRAIQMAQQRGDFVARNHQEALAYRKPTKYRHTAETKKKLRDHMLRRLEEGTYPTLGRNFKGRSKSYPEQWWSSVISNRLPTKLPIEELPLGIYSLDFAWPTLKKCLEVDGEQHNEPLQSASDIRKDAFLEREGWQVLRLRWKDTVKNKEKHIELLLEFLEA